MTPAKVNETYDTVIVGAGASGAYTFLRLSEDIRQAGKVCLIEATPRTNGRVMSIYRVGESRARPAFELGAMRFMRHHVIVRSLINHLNLETTGHTFPTEFLHLRGRRIPFADGQGSLRGLSPRFGEVYFLDQRESGRSPVALFVSAMFRAFKDIRDQLSSPSTRLKSWLDELASIGPENPWPYLTPELAHALKTTAKLYGIPLYEIGFWNLLQYYTSTEGFHFLRDGLGYYSITSEWNAADALVRFVNELRPKGWSEYETLVSGMGCLLDSMYKKASGRLGDAIIYPNHQVIQVEKLKVDSNGPEFRITVLRRADNLPFKKEPIKGSPTIKELVLETRRLFLCIPSGAVKRIHFLNFHDVSYIEARTQSEVRGEQALHNLVSSVKGCPLQKIVLVFSSPWWNTKYNLGFALTTKIITDTAVRQIYFDGRDRERAIIMLYADGPPVGAWESLQALEDSRGLLPALSGDTDAYAAVSVRMFDKLARLFALLLEIERDGIPMPICAGMKTWGGWPEWAGWHSWRTGYRSTEVRRLLAKPIANCDSFGICGEAYSTTQGWIEGAFRSAEYMLSKQGATPASWIDARLLNEIGVGDVGDYVDS